MQFRSAVTNGSTVLHTKSPKSSIFTGSFNLLKRANEKKGQKKKQKDKLKDSTSVSVQ